MENVKKFGALCGKFSDIADFVTVYISEGILEYLKIYTLNIDFLLLRYH